jgi:hypothetical protein
MITKNSIVWCFIALFALSGPEVFAQVQAPAGFSVEFSESFDYPGSVASTQPQKISDRRAIVGVYVDFSGIQRGFVRFRHGDYSDPLVDPNDDGGITQGRGINRTSTICGDFTNAGIYHGFFTAGKDFHDYDVPGSSWTIALGINNAGDFCGSDIPSSGVQSGYVNINGVISEFVIPGASNTLAYSINSSNQAAGYYIDGSGFTHGFYRDSDGSLVFPIDPAGSTGTLAFGNNDNNYIVGRYSDASGLTHGFVFVPPSTYVTFDVTGSTFTSLNGINRAGMIVGRYLDNSGIEHGLLARLVSTANSPATPGVVPQRHSPTEGLVRPIAVKPRLEEPAL